MAKSSVDLLEHSRNFYVGARDESLPGLFGLQRTRKTGRSHAHRYPACHGQVRAQRNHSLWGGQCDFTGGIAVSNDQVSVAVPEYGETVDSYEMRDER